MVFVEIIVVGFLIAILALDKRKKDCKMVVVVFVETNVVTKSVLLLMAKGRGQFGFRALQSAIRVTFGFNKKSYLTIYRPL